MITETAYEEGVEAQAADPAWTAALPCAESVAREAGRAVLAACARGGGAVSLLLADDATLRDLNARFRGVDKATNVLAFPAPAGAGGPLGDVALAFGVCEREAREQGKSLADHLRHLTVHGVLHLLGYDHGSAREAEDMEALERGVLAGLGVADPYA